MLPPMVSVTSLWLPILLSAVVVFVVSSVLHVVLPWHHGDLKKLPAEDAVMDALRPFEIPPGDYVFPCAGDMQAMKDPSFLARYEKGPVAFMTVYPSRRPAMGKSLVLWFVYCCVVGLFAAYVTSRALGPGAPYRTVFRFAGAVAFTGYALALWQSTIWYGRALSTTVKSTIDGLLYALFTAGVMGWLWPR